MAKYYSRWLRWLLLVVLAVGLCASPTLIDGGSDRAVAQVSAGSLVEQGLRSYQAGQYTDAITTWEQALSKFATPQERAIIHTNLGQAYRQIGKPDQAIAQWEKAVQIYQGDRDLSSKQALSQVLTEQAQVYSDLGQHQSAVDRLETAIKLAQNHRDPATEAAAQGSLGNAYWALGNYKEALEANQISLDRAQQIKNSQYIAIAYNNLGNVYASRSDRYCFQARAAGYEEDRFNEAKLSEQAAQDRRSALDFYQRSAQAGTAQLAEARALLNLNRLLQKAPIQTNAASICRIQTVPADGQIQAVIRQNRNRILALLTAAPDSQDKAYGLINLANSLMGKGTQDTQPQAAKATSLNPITLLNSALDVARKIGDKRAESFALGTLGEIYEAAQQYTNAMQVTRDAQFRAQEIGAADSLYRWQWQIGRILKATGRQPEAITAYQQAIATLQSIRGDIVVANKDLQFDFRDAVEPVYRELIGLLLSPTMARPTKTAQTAGTEQLKSLGVASPSLQAVSGDEATNVKAALEILELLKLAELQNFFGDDCVQVARDAATAEQSLPSGSGNESRTEAIDPKAAVIYSIVLDDSTYVILRLPNGSLKKYPVLFSAADLGAGTKQTDVRLPIGSEQLQKKVDTLRRSLEDRAREGYSSDLALSIYNALISPMERDLEIAKPSTLVFVNDGVLRKVPMAALYDGNQFLIQKYPIATTPSLSLTTRRPFQRNNTNALILGLTVAQSSFAALPNVDTEVRGVQKILGGTKLIDQQFTRMGMQQRLEKTSYPIIHMATHGKFGADADSTFLQAYNERITINKLDEVLRSRRSEQPVELLTLSACQTAAGDNRSALGIAGIAVRAGVKSAIATLWFIGDQPTVDLIETFYKQLLQPGITKAEALQRAQLELIAQKEYRHPAVWSPFILIGNWL